MVDLVKIRQKAREQKEAGGESPAESSAAPEEPKASPGPKKTGAARKKKRTTKSARKKTAAPPQVDPPAETTEPHVTQASGAVEGLSTPETEPGRSAETGRPASAGEESRLTRFKRTAGVMERDAEEDEGGETEAADGMLELLTFALAGELYSIDVDKLVEIIVPRSSTRVPNAPAEVIGIISLRGSIVTLLDLRMVLGHKGRGKETEDTRIVVIQHENERIGFTVDKVLRVVKVDPDSIEAHPVVSVAERNDAVHGVFVTGDAITIYLDLDRIAS